MSTSNDELEDVTTAEATPRSSAVLKPVLASNSKTKQPRSKVATFLKAIDIRAWVSIFLLMALNVPVVAPMYGVSLVIDEMRSDLNTSTTAVGWIISAPWFLSSAFSILAGVFVTPYNCLSAIKAGQFMCIVSLYVSSKITNVVSMFFTLGIVYGVGCNLVYYAISTQGAVYFPGKSQVKQCKAANAFVQIALALGQMMSGPVFTYFKQESSWQDALQFSAILLFVVGFVAVAILESLARNTSNPEEQAKRNASVNRDSRPPGMKFVASLKRQFSTETLKLPAFYWLNFDLFLFWASNLIGLMYLPTAMKAKGYVGQQITILMIQGGAGALGRSSITAFSLMWPNPIKFFKFFPMKGAILAVCFLTSFGLPDPWSYYLLSMGVGFSNAIASASLVNVCQEVLGKKVNSFTWVLLSVGSGGLCGPILGAVIFDLSGSYRLAFELAATMACVSAALSVLAAIARHSKERKKNLHEEKMKKKRSSKKVPLESLAPVLYLKRTESSYFVFERRGDKYQYRRVIDRIEPMKKSEVVDVDELFHGKFDFTNAYLPYDAEDEIMETNQNTDASDSRRRLESIQSNPSSHVKVTSEESAGASGSGGSPEEQ